MKLRSSAICALLLAVASVFGCGDDDDDVVPPPTNTAPTAVFTVSSDSGGSTTQFIFDAVSSFDAEDEAGTLEMRWDWDSDGNWDTAASRVALQNARFCVPGTRSVRLEVRDSGGLTDTSSAEIYINADSAAWSPIVVGPAQIATERSEALRILMQDLAVFDDKLHVATLRGPIVTCSPASWTQTSLLGSANAFAEFNGELLAAGTFTKDLDYYPVARLVGNDWQTMFGQMNRDAAAIIEYDGAVIIGVRPDRFARSQPQVFRWDGNSWEELGGGLPGSDVFDFAIYDGELVASGIFDSTEFFPGGLAAWDGTSWERLGDAQVSPVALTVYNGDLIVGGNFDAVAGVPAEGIARWDGATWSALGDGFSINPFQAGVLSLTEYDGDLIAGGEIETSGSTPISNVARWNGTSWEPIGVGLGSVIQGDKVSAVVPYRGDLIAGGLLQVGGGVYALARWRE
jgi:hypothetical protein